MASRVVLFVFQMTNFFIITGHLYFFSFNSLFLFGLFLFWSIGGFSYGSRRALYILLMIILCHRVAKSFFQFSLAFRSYFF